MIAGIMAIQAGDNPRIVEQKLNAYLPPKLRVSQFDK
jgi:chemotaxis protein MotA